ncbi:hypothetical protein [Caenispirillum bisanense]|uniref:hypothetical protein n=1 Tax=Caenispirillum bisanense TaxID=414052 RepID=UPI0031DB6B5E
MGLFARLFNLGGSAPAVIERDDGQGPRQPVPTEDEQYGNPDLLAAIDRLENPRKNQRLDVARDRVMTAFDDEEQRRRMVAAVRRLLHEGRPPRDDGP